jgi:hypothetical protein
MKICGLRVDIQEVHGPFCKVAGIKEFPDLIYMAWHFFPVDRAGVTLTFCESKFC